MALSDTMINDLRQRINNDEDIPDSELIACLKQYRIDRADTTPKEKKTNKLPDDFDFNTLFVKPSENKGKKDENA